MIRKRWLEDSRVQMELLNHMEHDLPCAVEGRNGISIILRVLQELNKVVSGNNTSGNIAFIDHFE